MKIKASAAAALMLAAGLFVSFAAPSPATAAGSEGAAAAKPDSATTGKSVKNSSRYAKKKRYAYRKSSKSAETRKAPEREVADASASARSATTESAMTETVANANAQLNSDAAQDSARDRAKAMSQAMSGKANTILLASADNSANGQAPAEGAAVTAPDQLNDVDRALQESPSTQTVAMATIKPAQQEAAVLASNNDSLDRTSLIGKIFIGFGALLTMASAARMFMA